MLNSNNIVAIDGPSGSGKSTIAILLAKKLEATYIDTGAMFRALAYFLNKKEINLIESEELSRELNSLDFKYGLSDSCLVQINGENLTNSIRQHYVSELASKLSKLDIVRDYLLAKQREIAEKTFCIMEGRDIGTVVFPKAFVKIFLTAKTEERAKRRLKQLEEKGDSSHSLVEILSDLEIRDKRDSNRKKAPLKPAEDSIIIDSSNLSIDQVVNNILTIVEERRAKNNSH